jgi:hypothetical protein
MAAAVKTTTSEHAIKRPDKDLFIVPPQIVAFNGPINTTRRSRASKDFPKKSVTRSSAPHRLTMQRISKRKAA